MEELRRVYSWPDGASISLSDRVSTFFTHLRRKIKFSLFSSKREDPDVRIEEPIDMDIYEQLLKSKGVTNVSTEITSEKSREPER